MLDPDLRDHEGVLGTLRGRLYGWSCTDVDHRPGPAPTHLQVVLYHRNTILCVLEVRANALDDKRTLLWLLLLVVVLMVVAAVLVTVGNH